MKIVTYNINGLRQRVNQHGSLLKLLDSLDADIICLQETKLSRQDLSTDLTMADGYEAFLSCTRSSRGRFAYSGVATFCRVKSAFSSDEVSLPIAAEEGFTGLLESTKREITTGDNLLGRLLETEGVEDVTNEYLLKVDSEGRCIITDHGHFVLFNLYGPRADEDDKERILFKQVFYKVLQKRWESMLSQGKRVIVVGDLNIAPYSMDRCDADPDFEKNVFRKWLRSLFTEAGGPFFDVFRSKHPERRGAYTHFSPHIGAEEFNYGSRIDHILIAGPCLHEEHSMEGHNFFECHAVDCDIMTQFTRGMNNNTSKWQGGRNTKLEGSDHIPVYATLRSLPSVALHNTPSLAVRYIPEVRGRQQTIVSFLKRREYPTNSEKPDESNSISHEIAESGQHSASSSNFCSTKTNHIASVSYARLTKNAKRTTHCQLTLKSFFGQPKVPTSDGDSVSSDTQHLQGDGTNENYNTPPETEQACNGESIKSTGSTSCELNNPQADPCVQNLEYVESCIGSKMEKDNNAVLEWQKIQEKMRTSIPLCKGHNEPCVARAVKKGPNIGRRFYVCARAKGPESEPEANCNFFQWASMRSKRKNNK